MIKEHLFAQLSQAVHSSKADRLKRHFFLVSSALIGRLNYKHRRSYIHTASQASQKNREMAKNQHFSRVGLKSLQVSL